MEKTAAYELMLESDPDLTMKFSIDFRTNDKDLFEAIREVLLDRISDYEAGICEKM